MNSGSAPQETTIGVITNLSFFPMNFSVVGWRFFSFRAFPTAKKRTRRHSLVSSYFMEPGLTR
jgi:hypothetical protein